MHIKILFFSLIICLIPFSAQSQTENSLDLEEIQKEEFRHPQEKIEEDEKIHGFFEERELEEERDYESQEEREIVSPAEPPLIE